MSDGNGKSSGTIGMKLYLFLDFVAIFFLVYKNYLLKQEVDVCNKQIQYLSEYIDEFHKNLYAQVDGSYRDGAHSLSISDVYYRKYFKSSDGK